jgi:N6-L-threonylcarbamoyladenine synthase
VHNGALFPYLLLLVSGGHCQCVAVEGVGQYVRLGGTIDDAAGEAFDKVAKLLGLGWPGGPALERLAVSGNPKRHDFPRPLLRRAGCDFSFSGLKTAVAREVAKHPAGALPVSEAADVAASFQAARPRSGRPSAGCRRRRRGQRCGVRGPNARGRGTRLHDGGAAGAPVHR